MRLGDRLEGRLGSNLLSGNRGRLSDGLRLGNSDSGLLDGWVVILRSMSDHLRDWEDWSSDLELSGVDVWMVGSAEERLDELRSTGQLVGRDSVGSWSLLNDCRWAVVAGRLNESVSTLGSLKEQGHLLEGISELGLLVLLLVFFGGNAELLQDPLALVTGGNSGVGVVEEGSE